MVGSRRPALSTDCVYVTAGWGVHDERWITALRRLGHDPATISLTRDMSETHLTERLAVTGSGPVLAGPLDRVTGRVMHAVAPDRRVVGLSWGFDLPMLARQGELRWLQALDGLILDSKANIRLARSSGVSPTRICFLPWGVDLGSFNPDGEVTAPPSLGLPVGQQMVLSLRAHEKQYRVEDIIYAWHRIADAHEDATLVIGNHGSRSPQLKDLAQVLGLGSRIIFIGLLTELELAPLLRGATCYLSSSEMDGTSVTLLQAMACKTPVLVSDTPGNRGWVNSRTGYLFPVGDIPSLTAALDSVLSRVDGELVAAAHDLVTREANWALNIVRLEEFLFGHGMGHLPDSLQ